jgi:ketosteroid isomerase-like protein
LIGALHAPRFKQLDWRVSGKSSVGDFVADLDKLAIARQYLARLSDGAGPDEVAAFYAPDVVQEEFPNRLMPSGATRDLQTLKEGRARGLALLQKENFEVLNAVASGEQVAMEVVWTATIAQAAGPFAAGQSLRAHFAIFMEFRDGLIVRQRNYDCFDPW